MTTSRKTADDLRNEVQQTLAELTTLRDELRVRAHLFGMDVRAALDRLDPQYLQMRDALRDAKDEALVSLSHGVSALHGKLVQIRRQMDSTDGA